MSRSISTIAREIKADWQNVYFGARPYLDAMHQIHNINDCFGWDSADSIVRYFLSNAQTWKGENARRIKAELKDILKGV